ncbi:MAG: PTS sugar transporter subunit IIA [Candidatus Riflebacteria bacterium]|nr:PTS sugar transporter subunit IIA [Candidatus Riflebacteria bacterium]
MRLTNLLQPELIKLDLENQSKVAVLEELISLLAAANRIKDQEGFTRAVLDRESQRSSGIGRGVAIPHARNEAISQPSIALGRSREGIDFEALDHGPVHLIFLLATPLNAGADHLKALARLARILRHPEYRQALLDANTKDEIIKIIEEAE